MTGIEKVRALAAPTGAFNIFNVETLSGVLDGARSADAGVYVQTSASVVGFYGASCLAGMVRAFLPGEWRERVVLHLDHCLDLGMIARCIECGWDSVMIDASSMPLEENIRLTAEVVVMAHAAGVAVEGEIGVVGGAEDGFEAYAGPGARVDPEDAERFILETGVDLAAIGAGTKHGVYPPGGCEVETVLLRNVHRRCPGVPLVLHGGSGIPVEQLSNAVMAGVRKINFSTEIKQVWLDVVAAHASGDDAHNVVGGMSNVRAAVGGVVEKKARMFASMSS